ncbi:HEAT repeat domain-containing protein [Erythrobacter rubeus]|uniref:HEAT repeat domain-containing protein n=1 Tax=Erythrobacter rubeus TaxID=2760803 RepID=A0ABR8KV65_9SPHN|nr:HEAT repeat domain-containing protein [Erythrobacter rubeus]MBD2842314.1 HEAT repeat domain-containing protein [Erythrobacter rubeus]
MQMHSEIAALRSDPALQRRVQSRMSRVASEWSADLGVRTVASELARYDSGSELSECPSLQSLFTDPKAAASFTAEWQRHVLCALRDEPLGEVQHRYRCADGLTSVQLLQSGEATLNLVAYERRERPNSVQTQTALFSDRESMEIVLSGSGRGRHYSRNEGVGSCRAITADQCDWHVGDTIAVSGPYQARQVVDVDGSMVLLQLSRTPRQPKPTQEFRLVDSALLRSTSGDKSASERLMALAVIGAMDHRQALPLMAERARDLDEDLDVRWEAVRQTLGLDTARGLALLASLRGSSLDPLSGPARDLEARLLRRSPTFSCSQEREVPCRN